MSGAVLSWAEHPISAAHRGDDGAMHGHTWIVRAYWEYEGESIVDLSTMLERVCRKLDHTVLPEHLRRAEDMAGYIGDLVGAVRVEIRRDAERMGATWAA